MKAIQPQKNFVFFFISELQVSCDQLIPSINTLMYALTYISVLMANYVIILKLFSFVLFNINLNSNLSFCSVPVCHNKVTALWFYSSLSGNPL